MSDTVTDGLVIVDKAGGMTSNSALQGARRLFSAAKAGHTGTLDPLATGLLPLCFGEATKFSADLLDADNQVATAMEPGQKGADLTHLEIEGLL